MPTACNAYLASAILVKGGLPYQMNPPNQPMRSPTAGGPPVPASGSMTCNIRGCYYQGSIQLSSSVSNSHPSVFWYLGPRHLLRELVQTQNSPHHYQEAQYTIASAGSMSHRERLPPRQGDVPARHELLELEDAPPPLIFEQRFPFLLYSDSCRTRLQCRWSLGPNCSSYLASLRAT